ncbi:RNA 2',3'-cyclic phosphodiesterase [Pseudomonas sp. CrR25]|nr:RNA 2',3'-cyclic phosphodiesterase [Pseudomonas sp. CrR25]
MKNDALRLFFALDCPPQLAVAIAAWRDELRLGGRPVATANLHLTLAFLGQQPRARLAELMQIGASLHAPAFDLHLDRLVRRRNGLLYLTSSQPSSGLLELAERLRNALLEVGFDLECRPFFAHVSLLRHCPKLPPGLTPSFDWPARYFTLFASEQGPSGIRYRQVDQWPLWRND